MKTIRVSHTTLYRYNCRVRCGEHRMMFRPRDSHDMDLVAVRDDGLEDAGNWRPRLI